MLLRHMPLKDRRKAGAAAREEGPPRSVVGKCPTDGDGDG